MNILLRLHKDGSFESEHFTLPEKSLNLCSEYRDISNL